MKNLAPNSKSFDGKRAIGVTKKFFEINEIEYQAF